MPKELNSEEYARLLRPENKMAGLRPYRYYFGEDTYGYYLLTDKQYKACYYHEHTFCGDIEFHTANSEVVLSFTNCVCSISDTDVFHIRWDRGWFTLEQAILEMADFQPIITIMQGD